MARPTSKKELLTMSQKNYELLTGFIDSLSEELRNREFNKGTMNRNIRDVLAHLHQWHVMLLDWYTAGLKGIKPDIPSKGYTWKTTPELNKRIWENCQTTDLKKIRKALDKTHSEVLELIKKHSENDLFEKKKYKWTGSTSIAAYLISATSSHYDWALKLIKKGLK
ncbi:MAG: ClbS/DfsB family four-helix bundle protein [Saprospiraceae bacterium]|nr:ClbS/DfsB family four-helix bundle protein [Saprospiraceae bacterium]